MNETTRESSWDAPILAPKMATELTAVSADTAVQGEGEGETAATVSASWARDDGGNENHNGVGSSGQEQALVVPPAAEPQFAFYVNERGNRVFLVPRKSSHDTSGGA